MYPQFGLFAYRVHTEILRTKGSTFAGSSFIIQSQACFCIPLHTTMAVCHSATICSLSVWRYSFLWRVRLPLMKVNSCRSSTNLQFPKRLYQPQRFPRTCPRCLRDSWEWHNQTSTWICISEIPFLCSHLFWWTTHSGKARVTRQKHVTKPDNISNYLDPSLLTAEYEEFTVTWRLKFEINLTENALRFLQKD